MNRQQSDSTLAYGSGPYDCTCPDENTRLGSCPVHGSHHCTCWNEVPGRGRLTARSCPVHGEKASR